MNRHDAETTCAVMLAQCIDVTYVVDNLVKVNARLSPNNGMLYDVEDIPNACTFEDGYIILPNKHKLTVKGRAVPLQDLKRFKERHQLLIDLVHSIRKDDKADTDLVNEFIIRAKMRDYTEVELHPAVLPLIEVLSRRLPEKDAEEIVVLSEKQAINAGTNELKGSEIACPWCGCEKKVLRRPDFEYCSLCQLPFYVTTTTIHTTKAADLGICVRCGRDRMAIKDSHMGLCLECTEAKDPLEEGIKRHYENERGLGKIGILLHSDWCPFCGDETVYSIRDVGEDNTVSCAGCSEKFIPCDLCQAVMKDCGPEGCYKVLARAVEIERKVAAHFMK